MEKVVAKTQPEGGCHVGTRALGAGQGGPAPGGCVWPLATPSRRLFAYLKPLDLKHSGTEKFSTKQRQSRRHLETLFGGFRSPVSAPCRMGESSPEASTPP